MERLGSLVKPYGSLFSRAVLYITLIGSISSPSMAQDTSLWSWWNPERGDNFATTKEGWSMPVDEVSWSGEHVAGGPTREGYTLYRLEGFVFDPLDPQPKGTVPLYSWYHPGRGDNFATTKASWSMPVDEIRWSGEHIVSGPSREGYTLYRLEGFVFDPLRPQPPGTVPLYSWYHPERGDNFATTKTSWSMPVDEIRLNNEHIVNGPLREDYRLYRLEGYIASAESITDSTSPTGVITANVKLPFLEKTENISYVVDGNTSIYQGDIILSDTGGTFHPEPEPHPVKNDFRRQGEISPANPPRDDISSGSANLVTITSDGIIDRNWLWNKGIIPYSIEQGDFTNSELRNILDGIDELNTRTNLNIVPKWKIQNHVHFKKDAEMIGAGRSKVGRGRIFQRLHLNTNASANTVVHELLHAAGAWHEQSRSDRDRFVEILWENVSEEAKHNFEKHVSDGFKVTPYDHNSIMHYGGLAFSRNGQPTIIARDTGNAVQGGFGLSQVDIDGINTAYPYDYYDEISRPVTSIRTVKTTILRVQSDDRDGGRKHEIDFYMKNETGPGWSWRPGGSSNPTERFKSGVREESDNDIYPNWEFNYTIARNEEFAKVWLKLRDDDGGSWTEGGISPDENVDINPFAGTTEVELYIDTVIGNIYLADIDGARLDENYIGSVGENIELEGFEGSLKAYINFRIDII